MRKPVYPSEQSDLVHCLDILKGTTTLMISIIYKKGLCKLWILILASSKSVEKWESCGHLKNIIWPTLSRHFEYLIHIFN